LTKKFSYINYHKHDHVSSIFTPDTPFKAEDFIKRAVELGDKLYFTTNHGSGGDIFEAKTLCDTLGCLAVPFEWNSFHIWCNEPRSSYTDITDYVVTSHLRPESRHNYPRVGQFKQSKYP
jgi:hypothetical protein